MSIAPNRMSARAMNDAAWRHRTDLAERIVARLRAAPCTVGRLVHDLSLPTCAVTVQLNRLCFAGTVARLSNNSPRYALAQEARAA